MNKEQNTINEKRHINKIKEDIKQALTDFCIDNNIDNMQEANQNIFSAFCDFAGVAVFPDVFILTAGIKQNKKIYDYFLIDQVASFYIFFCKLNNKIPSLIDFSSLINIDYIILKNWTAEAPTLTPIQDQTLQDLKKLFVDSYNNIGNYNIYINKLKVCEGDIITTLQASIIAKLQDNREASLKNILLSNKNPVGVLSVVNKEYKWNIETIKEETKIKALSLQELPQLNVLCKQDNKPDENK